jgi:hypothetical protein
MKPILTLVFILLVSCLPVFSWSQAPDPSLRQVQVDVVYLSSDLLEGREAGTVGERMAADYIAARFAEIGLEPAGPKGSWYNDFNFKYQTNVHGGGVAEVRQGINVVGYIDHKAKSTVVIGAHYDHLGYGAFGSRHTGEPAIHNGADDNASGVAGLLRLAEKLKSNPNARNNNYLFVAFSAEELGLIGSKVFASDSLLFDRKRTNYMLNMDMIGRLNDERVLAVNGAATSPLWKDALQAIHTNGIVVKTSDSGVGPSDHTSFYLQDLPVLHFFTGQHEDYHKPEDDAARINFKGIHDITDLMIRLIEYLDSKGKLPFTKTQDEEQGRRAATFKVSLGVMPDYVYDGEGMRVDGVTDGRPAQIAGIKKGDILLAIGEFPIKDIYDYMEGLSKFQKGDKSTVKIRRSEQVIELPVAF